MIKSAENWTKVITNTQNVISYQNWCPPGDKGPGARRKQMILVSNRLGPPLNDLEAAMASNLTMPVRVRWRTSNLLYVTRLTSSLRGSGKQAR